MSAMVSYVLVALVAIAAAVLPRYGRHLELPCPYNGNRVVNIPAAKRPAPSPLEGPYAPNTLLTDAHKLWEGADRPETVVVTEAGQAYLPVEGGNVVAASLAEPGRLELLARVGGRPIGLVKHPDGYLVVTDPVKGLLAVDLPSGTVRLLTNQVTEGDLSRAEAEIRFADDAVVASDGRIFFTDASAIGPVRRPDGSYDLLWTSKANFLEGRPSGRVLVYDPRDRSTAVVTSGIWFANGIALSADESFLVVAETFGCRLLRHWLRGERAGTTEVFLDNLPGLVDGVSASPDGRSFWAAIITLPPPSLPVLVGSRLARPLRWLVARLPQALQPNVQPYGLVVQVAANGTALRSLHDPSGQTCTTVTSATQVGGTLYLGSLGTDWVCAVDVSGLAA